jgi:hypothetical protein
MDGTSVTRPSPPSTKAITADEAFCRQVAALLLCEEAPVRDAFIGEPAEEVLEMVRWALSHEDDEGFDTAEVLTTWAKKRGRGAWSSRSPRTTLGCDDGAERLAKAVARMLAEHPESLAEAIRALERCRTANGRS